MVALGRPVVPDVNAIIATSSAAVATAAKSPGFAGGALGEIVRARRRRT